MKDFDNSKYGQVCGECGIAANVTTCLAKYGEPPKKLCFDLSTSHKGKCDWCGEIKFITEVRDFFYPTFLYLWKARAKYQKREIIKGYNSAADIEPQTE